MTWEQRTDNMERLQRCYDDPDLFVEYYMEHINNKEFWEELAAGAQREYDGPHLLCISPLCHRVHYHGGGDALRSLRRCDYCGSATMVKSDVLIEHGPPAGAIHNLLTDDISQIEQRHRVINDLLLLLRRYESAFVVYRGQRPYLNIDTDIPQLKTGGKHFIRGRVNREVLAERGFNINSSELLIGLVQVNIESAAVLRRLLSDEKIILDESKADKFRMEYIDNKWEEEFVVFANKLRENGVLQVDSSGIQDTLTALYNMAQKKSGKATIIKRDGSIVFPTQNVLENISQPLIERVFNITEHGRYDDISQVFAVGEGVEE
jgi:hypothetical protein